MVLASATMPDWVAAMIRKHLVDPLRVQVAGEASEPRLRHALIRVEREAKLSTLSRVLRQDGSVIVFGRTKHGVRKLAAALRRLQHEAVELQGNMSQSARDQAMALFRSGRSSVLVATNVAARGLDISHVGLVVNYDLPETSESLTHRVGRTARMGNEGRALTFVTPDDAVSWRRLRGQGAPDLLELDLEHLLGAGEWRCMPAAVSRAERVQTPARPAPARPAPARPAPARPARSRYRGRRRGRAA